MAMTVGVPARRARASIALTLAVVALVAFPVIDRALLDYREAGTALEGIAARHARLLGLRDAAPEVDAALATAEAELTEQAYPVAYGADRAGTDLQQRIRRIAGEVGIGVIGSQSMAPIESDGLRIVPVTATLDTDIASLRDFLLALEDEQPRILVDRLGIGSVRQRTGRQTHDLRVQIGLQVIELLP